MPYPGSYLLSAERPDGLRAPLPDTLVTGRSAPQYRPPQRDMNVRQPECAPQTSGKQRDQQQAVFEGLLQVRPRFVARGDAPIHPRRSSPAACRRCCSRTCFGGAGRRRRIRPRPPSPCSASCLAADAGTAPGVRSPHSQFRHIRMSVDPCSRSGLPPGGYIRRRPAGPLGSAAMSVPATALLQTSGFLVADARGRVVGRVECPMYGTGPDIPDALSVRKGFGFFARRRHVVPAAAIEQIDGTSGVIGLRVERESLRSFL